MRSRHVFAGPLLDVTYVRTEEEDSRRAPGPGDAVDRVFPGRSEMAGRCRALDWSSTPLGGVEQWPEPLRTVAGLVVASPTPMIALWGPELVQIYNDGYRDVMGAKHPAGLGQPTRECWPEVWGFTRPVYAGVMERGESFRFDEQLLVLERNGYPEEVYFRLAYGPVPDGAGGVGGILATVFETTPERRALAEAPAMTAERDELACSRETEYERLRSAILHAPVPMALHLGPEHRLEIVSESFRRVSGGRDVTGMIPREAYPDVLGQGILERLDEVYATGRPWSSPEIHVCYDRRGMGAEDSWFNLRYEPVFDAEGRVTGVLNFSLDVTEQVLARRQVEEQASALAAKTRELEESQNWLRRALEAAEMAFWDFDPKADTTVRSPHHDRFYGYEEPLEVWNFDTYLQHVHPDDRAHVADRFARALEHDEEWKVESRVVWPDGSIRWIATQGAVFRDARGTPLRVVGIITDATARREAEAERERLFREVEAANRSKSEFLAVMSHELRTPLNAIGGYVQLLEMGIHGPVTDAQSHALERVRKSQQHLLGLINEVLNYARLESGMVTYEIADVPVREVLASTEVLIEPQAQARGLALRVHGCPETLTVRADPEKLRQILLNLASNAVKFTDAGGRIEIACRYDGDEVALRVRDTGIGIPADKLESIFEPFVQVRAELTRTTEGTGLGLAISRDLARGMGGDLTAESKHGEGSTFTIHLPREAAEPAGLDPRPELPAEALTSVAELLLDHRDAILGAYTQRLRYDPVVGTAAAEQTDLALQDHGVNFLAGVSQSLGTRAADPETAGELADDTDEIQRTVSELHGTQRRRMGFSEEALRRDWAFLRDETVRVVRERARVGLEVAPIVDLLERIFGRAERTSQRAWRRSPGR